MGAQLKYLHSHYTIGPSVCSVVYGHPGNDTLNLHGLLKHNLIEHDARLSRKDAYFGNALDFDPEVWAGTSAVWRHTNAATVSVEAAAKSRLARIAKDKIENPEYNLTSAGEGAGLGETALLVATMGGKVKGNAPVDWVGIFRGSRLPFAEGWTRSTEVITLADIANMKAKIVEFSS
ncbi:putative chloroperoxidase-like protein [Diaporthe ampelina]|uniref:Putative chloroperoxidase-like protein n=1 Tax=Diaporthe ampelina TaxID=1214573 RepID=A0A0G2FN26_9PEZI|nr:putative chloroperoxidase-like protein [Diaporthe ampelina]